MADFQQPRLPLEVLTTFIIPLAYDGSGSQALNLLLTCTAFARKGRDDLNTRHFEGAKNFWFLWLVEHHRRFMASINPENVNMFQFYKLVPRHILEFAGVRGVVWSKIHMRDFPIETTERSGRWSRAKLRPALAGEGTALPLCAASYWEEGSYLEGFFNHLTGAYAGPCVVYSYDHTFFGDFDPESEAWAGDNVKVKWLNGMTFEGRVGGKGARPWRRSGRGVLSTTDGLRFEGTFESEVGGPSSTGTGILSGRGHEPEKVTISSRSAEWSRFGEKFMFQIYVDGQEQYSWGSEHECALWPVRQDIPAGVKVGLIAARRTGRPRGGPKLAADKAEQQ